MGEEAKAEAAFDDRYTAFVKWEYKPFIYVDEHTKPWISFKESFYRASEVIIKNLAAGKGFPDLEGIAAVFLFRHYLELALKTLVMRGRFLESADKNAAIETVKEVKWIHDLAELWELVLRDAKPKIDPKDWDSYDILFVEKCIAEFHQRDEKGFALRYQGQGGEHFDYNFVYFTKAMEHVYQILEGLTVYLIETYGQNEEWEEILNSY
jgi:hypothetical protein